MGHLKKGSLENGIPRRGLEMGFLGKRYAKRKGTSSKIGK